MPKSPAFFRIPILPPILASYDAPAPVIIPPGSDLCPSNPNAYCHQGIDVDPCVVVSRSEGLTQKVDLSPSEHAGVSLCEPATTNSEVVSPQIMNDVTCNSDKGTIHLNNTTINQESEEEKNQDLDNITDKKFLASTVIAGIIDQESAKKKQDLLQKESSLVCSFPKSLFVCDIPEPGRDYPKIATVEVDESLFKNLYQVRNPKCLNKHNAVNQHQTNIQISEKAPITKTMEESKLVCKTAWCEICKVSCATNAYDTHALGRKHIKKLQKLPTLPSSPVEKLKLTGGEVVNPYEGNSMSCELCGISCTSWDMFNKHISGKKHQKNLKNSGHQSLPKTTLAEPMTEEGEIVLSEGSKRKANDSLSSEEDADTKRQKMNEEESCGVLVTCKVCNVGCYGLMAYKTHLASFEHSSMVLKQATGGSNGFISMKPIL